MFLTLVVLADLKSATLRVEHPEFKMETPVVIGKSSTPTPIGVYLLRRAYSTQLRSDVLVFMKDGNEVWAIHPNLRSRAKQLASETPDDNDLSNGCIGIGQSDFDRLWDSSKEMVLQVY